MEGYKARDYGWGQGRPSHGARQAQVEEDLLLVIGAYNVLANSKHKFLFCPNLDFEVSNENLNSFLNLNL